MVASTLPTAFVPMLLQALAEYLGSSPHVEFLLSWVRALCMAAGPQLEAGRSSNSSTIPALRALQKVGERGEVGLGYAAGLRWEEGGHVAGERFLYYRA